MPAGNSKQGQPYSQFESAVCVTATTLVLGGLTITVLLGHLTYNTTPSAPTGWYWYTPVRRDVPLRRGQHVLIAPPAWVRQELRRVAPRLNADRPWMKTIVAVAGDTVCLEDDRVTINGQERGQRPLLRDYALPHLTGCTVLAAERYFVMNDHPRSFDSRYVGAFARTAIRGTVQALYTWEAR
jgi:conjugative transfer signal peptidase TraF